MRYGWNFSSVSTVATYFPCNLDREVDKEKNKVPCVSITERKISFVNVNGQSREIHHLHYDGWLDQCPCENEDLLLLLLERVEELSSGKKINLGCHHSRSRSATVLVSHLLRQEIRAQVAAV